MRTCRTTTSRDQKSSKSHSRGGWTLTYFRGNHPDLEPHGEEVGGAEESTHPAYCKHWVDQMSLHHGCISSYQFKSAPRRKDTLNVIDGQNQKT